MRRISINTISLSDRNPVIVLKIFDRCGKQCEGPYRKGKWMSEVITNGLADVGKGAPAQRNSDDRQEL